MMDKRVLLLLILLAPSIAGVYQCSSCSQCKNKLQTASPGDTVVLVQDISASGTCINDPSMDDNITLDCNGHSITGSGSGIGIRLVGGNSDHITVKNCEISNFRHGILISSSVSNVLSHINVHHNQKQGIYIKQSSSNQLLDVNTHHNQGNGILVESSSSTFISNVIAHENGSHGIYIRQYSSTTMSNITAHHNHGSGVFISNSSSTTISNIITHHNKHGIFIQQASSISVDQLESHDNDQYGVLLKSVSSISLSQAHTHQNKVGIRIRQSGSIQLDHIHTHNNSSRGIEILYSSSVSMADVYSHNNDTYGLYMANASATVDLSSYDSKFINNPSYDLFLSSSSLTCSGCGSGHSLIYHTYSGNVNCPCSDLGNPNLLVPFVSPVRSIFFVGETYSFHVTVQNTGWTDTDTNVALLINGSEVDREGCYVPAGGACHVTLHWTPARVGTDLNFVADPDDTVAETDETDNYYSWSGHTYKIIYSGDPDNDGNSEYWVDSTGDSNVDHYLDEDDNVFIDTDNRDYDGDGNVEYRTDINGDGKTDGYFDPDTNTFSFGLPEVASALTPALAPEDMLLIELLAGVVFFVFRTP